MFIRSLMLCGLLVTAMFVSSCFLDPDEGGGTDEPPTPPIELEDLTERWHVLNNIEYAYKNREGTVYDELLDQSFTFFFDEGDVGGEIPAQWDRREELGATGRLFASNAQPEPPADPVCNQIRLDLAYDKDNIAWVEVIPETAPTETWWLATVNYNFTFKMEPDDTFIQPDAKAQFTVRNVGTVSEPHWQLVEFRDLGKN